MLFYELIPTKLFRADSGALTYASTQTLTPGQIVLAPLGRSTIPAIVYRPVPQPDFPCKEILKILYQTPLPTHLLKTLTWLSDYYLAPLPSVASLILPVGVHKTRRKAKTPAASPNASAPIPSSPSVPSSPSIPSSPSVPSSTPIPLNAAQRQALSELSAISNSTKLLFGITGSGKTNLYLSLAQATLAAGRSIILLVPEIALTSQLVQIFESTFPGKTILLHSRQTESERHLTWESILQSTDPMVIIGPRSALFAPLHNLGLIIVDEAHESSYSQDSNPKYSALRLSSFIAQTLKITCLLGSATPLVSDFYLAKTKHSLVSLTTKAKASAITPEIKIVDFTSRADFSQSRYFSDPLLATIKTNLKQHQQTLIYHNRRGSAPLTLCESCGWQALCPNCFLPLTLHSDSYTLLCHTCGYSGKIPSSCPECHSPAILHKGFGTKLLESELQKLFKHARIVRFDADNKKGETLDSRFAELQTGAYDIIIGTQTVSRGLDLPHLASIGIVQADAGLSLPDFSAEEKTFELLTQVIGRVGRGHLSTASVIIQTFRPSDPVINFAVQSDYSAFYQYLIQKRRRQFLPPFAYLAKVSVTYKTEATALKKIRQISVALHTFLAQTSAAQVSSTSIFPAQTQTSKTSPRFFISPPTPCFHERTTSGYSWQIVLKSTNRQLLLSALATLDPKLSAHIYLDPPSLL